MKKCGGCKIEKYFSEFYRNKSTRDGLNTYCKDCWKEKQNSPGNKIKANKRNYTTGKNRKRASYFKEWGLKKRYGMCVADYDRMLLSQSGKCAICYKDHSEVQNGLRVDHDHETNKVRDLLCMQCNTALGHFNDNILVLENAIKYLNKHKIEKLSLIEGGLS